MGPLHNSCWKPRGDQEIDECQTNAQHKDIEQMSKIAKTTGKAFVAMMFLFIPFAAPHLTEPVALAQQAGNIDPATDRNAIDKVMHDYYEAYSSGDMAAVIKFINVPLMVTGPQSTSRPLPPLMRHWPGIPRSTLRWRSKGTRTADGSRLM